MLFRFKTMKEILTFETAALLVSGQTSVTQAKAILNTTLPCVCSVWL